MSYINMTTS